MRPPKNPKPEHVLRASPDEAHEAMRAQLLELDSRLDAAFDLIDVLTERLDALAPPTP